MCKLDGCGADQDMPPIPLSNSDRRKFLAGLCSLPLATVLFHPELAAAQASKLTPVEIPTAQGGMARGVLALPEKTPAPAVVIIHEWWGLNDSIKAVAAELAELGFVALAIDLYGGETGGTPDEARALMQAMDPAGATAELSAAIEHLRGHEASNGKVGTMGWCFGGGWSLNASIATPVDATVIYYGRVTRGADDLAQLSGPVLGHFGTLDRSINEKMVGGFQREMANAGKGNELSVHWYTADHAFANPSSARYDADDAALAWSRTQAFLNQHLNG